MSRASENIAKKKSKILAQELLTTLENFKQHKSVAELIKHFKTGRDLQLSAIKLFESDIQKKKPYLLKKAADPLVVKVSSDILRILSDKKFASKATEIFATKKENAANSAGAATEPDLVALSAANLIKWDFDLRHIGAPRDVLKNPIYAILGIPEIDDAIIARSKELGQEIDFEEKLNYFVKNYSRLVGVLGVLGKTDYNPDNIMMSVKTFRPVEIDSASFVNDQIEGQQEKMIGSSFTNDFLRIFLGQDPQAKKAYAIFCDNKKLFDDTISEEDSLNYGRELNKIYIDSYKKDIDIILLEKIKINIEKNPFLKECFIEMMQGIEDAIELANDDVFLAEYVKKFEGIKIAPTQKTAPELIALFKENAAQAREQYILFLQHFEQINQARDQKAPLKYEISQKEFVELLEREREFTANSMQKNNDYCQFYQELCRNRDKSIPALSKEKLEIAAEEKQQQTMIEKLSPSIAALRAENLHLQQKIEIFNEKLQAAKKLLPKTEPKSSEVGAMAAASVVMNAKATAVLSTQIQPLKLN